MGNRPFFLWILSVGAYLLISFSMPEFGGERVGKRFGNSSWKSVDRFIHSPMIEGNWVNQWTAPGRVGLIGSALGREGAKGGRELNLPSRWGLEGFGRKARLSSDSRFRIPWVDQVKGGIGPASDFRSPVKWNRLGTDLGEGIQLRIHLIFKALRFAGPQSFRPLRHKPLLVNDAVLSLRVRKGGLLKLPPSLEYSLMQRIKGGLTLFFEGQAGAHCLRSSLKLGVSLELYRFIHKEWVRSVVSEACFQWSDRLSGFAKQEKLATPLCPRILASIGELHQAEVDNLKAEALKLQALGEGEVDSPGELLLFQQERLQEAEEIPSPLREREGDQDCLEVSPATDEASLGKGEPACVEVKAASDGLSMGAPSPFQTLFSVQLESPFRQASEVSSKGADTPFSNAGGISAPAMDSPISPDPTRLGAGAEKIQPDAPASASGGASNCAEVQAPCQTPLEGAVTSLSNAGGISAPARDYPISPDPTLLGAGAEKIQPDAPASASGGASNCAEVQAPCQTPLEGADTSFSNDGGISAPARDSPISPDPTLLGAGAEKVQPDAPASPSEGPFSGVGVQPHGSMEPQGEGDSGLISLLEVRAGGADRDSAPTPGGVSNGVEDQSSGQLSAEAMHWPLLNEGESRLHPVRSLLFLDPIGPEAAGKASEHLQTPVSDGRRERCNSEVGEAHLVVKREGQSKRKNAQEDGFSFGTQSTSATESLETTQWPNAEELGLQASADLLEESPQCSQGSEGSGYVVPMGSWRRSFKDEVSPTPQDPPFGGESIGFRAVEEDGLDSAGSSDGLGDSRAELYETISGEVGEDAQAPARRDSDALASPAPSSGKQPIGFSEVGECGSTRLPCPVAEAWLQSLVFSDPKIKGLNEWRRFPVMVQSPIDERGRLAVSPTGSQSSMERVPLESGLADGGKEGGNPSGGSAAGQVSLRPLGVEGTRSLSPPFPTENRESFPALSGRLGLQDSKVVPCSVSGAAASLPKSASLSRNRVLDPLGRGMFAFSFLLERRVEVTAKEFIVGFRGLSDCLVTPWGKFRVKGVRIFAQFQPRGPSGWQVNLLILPDDREVHEAWPNFPGVRIEGRQPIAGLTDRGEERRITSSSAVHGSPTRQESRQPSEGEEARRSSDTLIKVSERGVCPAAMPRKLDLVSAFPRNIAVQPFKNLKEVPYLGRWRQEAASNEPWLGRKRVSDQRDENLGSVLAVSSRDEAEITGRELVAVLSLQWVRGGRSWREAELREYWLTHGRAELLRRRRNALGQRGDEEIRLEGRMNGRLLKQEGPRLPGERTGRVIAQRRGDRPTRGLPFRMAALVGVPSVVGVLIFRHFIDFRVGSPRLPLEESSINDRFAGLGRTDEAEPIWLETPAERYFLKESFPQDEALVELSDAWLSNRTENEFEPAWEVLQATQATSQPSPREAGETENLLWQDQRLEGVELKKDAAYEAVGEQARPLPAPDAARLSSPVSRGDRLQSRRSLKFSPWFGAILTGALIFKRSGRIGRWLVNQLHYYCSLGCNHRLPLRNLQGEAPSRGIHARNHALRLSNGLEGAVHRYPCYSGRVPDGCGTQYRLLAPMPVAGAPHGIDDYGLSTIPEMGQVLPVSPQSQLCRQTLYSAGAHLPERVLPERATRHSQIQVHGSYASVHHCNAYDNAAEVMRFLTEREPQFQLFIPARGRGTGFEPRGAQEVSVTGQAWSLPPVRPFRAKVGRISISRPVDADDGLVSAPQNRGVGRLRNAENLPALPEHAWGHRASRSVPQVDREQGRFSPRSAIGAVADNGVGLAGIDEAWKGSSPSNRGVQGCENLVSHSSSGASSMGPALRQVEVPRLHQASDRDAAPAIPKPLTPSACPSQGIRDQACDLRRDEGRRFTRFRAHPYTSISSDSRRGNTLAPPEVPVERLKNPLGLVRENREVDREGERAAGDGVGAGDQLECVMNENCCGTGGALDVLMEEAGGCRGLPDGSGGERLTRGLGEEGIGDAQPSVSFGGSEEVRGPFGVFFLTQQEGVVRERRDQVIPGSNPSERGGYREGALDALVGTGLSQGENPIDSAVSDGEVGSSRSDAFASRGDQPLEVELSQSESFSQNSIPPTGSLCGFSCPFNTEDSSTQLPHDNATESISGSPTGPEWGSFGGELEAGRGRDFPLNRENSRTGSEEEGALEERVVAQLEAPDPGTSTSSTASLSPAFEGPGHQGSLNWAEGQAGLGRATVEEGPQGGSEGLVQTAAEEGEQGARSGSGEALEIGGDGQDLPPLEREGRRGSIDSDQAQGRVGTGTPVGSVIDLEELSASSQLESRLPTSVQGEAPSNLVSEGGDLMNSSRDGSREPSEGSSNRGGSVGGAEGASASDSGSDSEAEVSAPQTTELDLLSNHLPPSSGLPSMGEFSSTNSSRSGSFFNREGSGGQENREENQLASRDTAVEEGRQGGSERLGQMADEGRGEVASSDSPATSEAERRGGASSPSSERGVRAGAFDGRQASEADSGRGSSSLTRQVISGWPEAQSPSIQGEVRPDLFPGTQGVDSPRSSVSEGTRSTPESSNPPEGRGVAAGSPGSEGGWVLGASHLPMNRSCLFHGVSGYLQSTWATISSPNSSPCHPTPASSNASDQGSVADGCLTGEEEDDEVSSGEEVELAQEGEEACLPVQTLIPPEGGLSNLREHYDLLRTAPCAIGLGSSPVYGSSLSSGTGYSASEESLSLQEDSPAAGSRGGRKSEDDSERLESRDLNEALSNPSMGSGAGSLSGSNSEGLCASCPADLLNRGGNGGNSGTAIEGQAENELEASGQVRWIPPVTAPIGRSPSSGLASPEERASPSELLSVDSSSRPVAERRGEALEGKEGEEIGERLVAQKASVTSPLPLTPPADSECSSEPPRSFGAPPVEEAVSASTGEEERGAEKGGILGSPTSQSRGREQAIASSSSRSSGRGRSPIEEGRRSLGGFRTASNRSEVEGEGQRLGQGSPHSLPLTEETVRTPVSSVRLPRSRSGCPLRGASRKRNEHEQLADQFQRQPSVDEVKRMRASLNQPNPMTRSKFTEIRVGELKNFSNLLDGATGFLNSPLSVHSPDPHLIHEAFSHRSGRFTRETRSENPSRPGSCPPFRGRGREHEVASLVRHFDKETPFQKGIERASSPKAKPETPLKVSAPPSAPQIYGRFPEQVTPRNQRKRALNSTDSDCFEAEYSVGRAALAPLPSKGKVSSLPPSSSPCSEREVNHDAPGDGEGPNSDRESDVPMESDDDSVSIGQGSAAKAGSSSHGRAESELDPRLGELEERVSLVEYLTSGSDLDLVTPVERNANGWGLPEQVSGEASGGTATAFPLQFPGEDEKMGEEGASILYKEQASGWFEDTAMKEGVSALSERSHPSPIGGHWEDDCELDQPVQTSNPLFSGGSQARILEGAPRCTVEEDKTFQDAEIEGGSARLEGEACCDADRTYETEALGHFSSVAPEGLGGGGNERERSEDWSEGAVFVMVSPRERGGSEAPSVLEGEAPRNSPERFPSPFTGLPLSLPKEAIALPPSEDSSGDSTLPWSEKGSPLRSELYNLGGEDSLYLGLEPGLKEGQVSERAPFREERTGERRQEPGWLGAQEVLGVGACHSCPSPQSVEVPSGEGAPSIPSSAGTPRLSPISSGTVERAGSEEQKEDSCGAFSDGSVGDRREEEDRGASGEAEGGQDSGSRLEGASESPTLYATPKRPSRSTCLKRAVHGCEGAVSAPLPSPIPPSPYGVPSFSSAPGRQRSEAEELRQHATTTVHEAQILRAALGNTGGMLTRLKYVNHLKKNKPAQWGVTKGAYQFVTAGASPDPTLLPQTYENEGSPLLRGTRRRVFRRDSELRPRAGGAESEEREVGRLVCYHAQKTPIKNRAKPSGKSVNPPENRIGALGQRVGGLDFSGKRLTGWGSQPSLAPTSPSGAVGGSPAESRSLVTEVVQAAASSRSGLDSERLGLGGTSAAFPPMAEAASSSSRPPALPLGGAPLNPGGRMGSGEDLLIGKKRRWEAMLPEEESVRTWEKRLFRQEPLEEPPELSRSQENHRGATEEEGCARSTGAEGAPDQEVSASPFHSCEGTPESNLPSLPKPKKPWREKRQVEEAVHASQQLASVYKDSLGKEGRLTRSQRKELRPLRSGGDATVSGEHQTPLTPSFSQTAGEGAPTPTKATLPMHAASSPEPEENGAPTAGLEGVEAWSLEDASLSPLQSPSNHSKKNEEQRSDASREAKEPRGSPPSRTPENKEGIASRTRGAVRRRRPVGGGEARQQEESIASRTRGAERRRNQAKALLCAEEPEKVKTAKKAGKKSPKRVSKQTKLGGLMSQPERPHQNSVKPIVQDEELSQEVAERLEVQEKEEARVLRPRTKKRPLVLDPSESSLSVSEEDRETDPDFDPKRPGGCRKKSKKAKGKQTKRKKSKE